MLSLLLLMLSLLLLMLSLLLQMLSLLLLMLSLLLLMRNMLLLILSDSWWCAVKTRRKYNLRVHFGYEWSTSWGAGYNNRPGLSELRLMKRVRNCSIDGLLLVDGSVTVVTEHISDVLFLDRGRRFSRVFEQFSVGGG